MTPDADLLAFAARQYYYKPMAAFFNAFLLRAYRRAGFRLDEPVLDAGCLDGTFGLLLTDALGVRPRLTGVEVNPAALRRTGRRARRRYDDMIHASATDLPFAAGTFRTVLFNASLFAIEPGLERAVREARRVVHPDGQLCVTVSTHLYTRSCWLARFLNGIGCPGLARRYVRAMDRRLMIAHPYSAAQWTSLLERHGWVVQQCSGFFSPQLTTWWSVLAWSPFRLFGLARLVPRDALRGPLSRLYMWCFRGCYQRAAASMAPEDSTYLWIRAVPAPGLPPAGNAVAPAV